MNSFTSVLLTRDGRVNWSNGYCCLVMHFTRQNWRLKVSGNGPVPCLLILLNFVAVVSDRRQAATRNLVVSISALTERRYRSALPIAMRSAPSIVRALYENAPRVRYLCADAHLLASLLQR